MTTIKASLNDQVLTAATLPKIACNNINTVRLSVTFDSAWAGYPARSAVFYTDKDPTRYEVILSSEGNCLIPHEVLSEKGKLYISVKGVSGDAVKTSAELEYKILAGTPSIVVSPPTGSVYSQLHEAVAVERARLNNLINMGARSIVGDAELADIRVGADGKTYETAGEAVRAQVYKYPFLVLHGTALVDFDTTSKTVTVPTIRAIGKASFIDVERTVLNFATNNGVNVVFIKGGALGICTTADIAKDMQLIFAFNAVSIPMFVGCSLPVANYTVNGKTFFDYKNSTVKRYGMQGFLSTVKTPVAFDTVQKNVSINIELRVQGERQLPITATEAVTLNWDMSGGATNYVYIKDGKAVCSVNAPSADDIYLFAFFRGADYLEEWCGCTLPVNMYTVNGLAYRAENIIKFSENRSTHIYIESDTKIYGNGHEINFGTPLTGTRQGNIFTVAYTPAQGSHFYKTFVDRTEGLLVETNRSYYNVTIWAFNGNKYEAIRLTPYLTLNEVETNDNSFTYLNGVITINSANYTDFVLAGEQDFGIAVTGNANVEIHDLKILFARGNCAIIKKGRVKFYNCEFGYCTTGNGLSVQNADCDTIGCKAYYNRNDGFNYHYTGHSNVIECEGYNNFDDGISHHEDCTFEINGGLWMNNGKGGIASPTYGAKGRISNVICVGNNSGIYAEATEVVNEDIYINGVLLKNNKKGISCINYSLIAANAVFVGNDEDTFVRDAGAVDVL